MKTHRVQTIALFLGLLLVWVVVQLPSWDKGISEAENIIDWSKVVDNPDELSTYDLVWIIGSPEQKLDKNAFVKEYFEDRFNISLRHKDVHYYKYQNALSLALAGGDIPDLFTQTSLQMGKSAKHGFIIPIPIELVVRTAPTYAAMVQKYAGYAWNAAKVDGFLYGLPLLIQYPFPRVGVWRRDWLDAVGISKIPETIDDYAIALKRFTQQKPDAKSFIAAFGNDLDASQKQMVLDNAHPTWGMSGDITVWQVGMFTDVFGAYGVQPFNWMMQDGELKWGGIQDGCRQALELLNEWYKKGYIHPDFITDVWYIEVLQKMYASITGYMAFWSHYNLNRVGGDVPNTTAMLQRNRDQELLINIGKTKAEARARIERESSRYINMWIPAKVPIGPGGHRGIRGGGEDESIEILTFGRQMATQPEKIIRWLRMMETILSDEKLMVLCGLGVEGVHWRWQQPGEINNNNVDKNENDGFNEGSTPLTYISDPESVIVAIKPYGTPYKRRQQGLTSFLELGSSIVHVPVPMDIRNKYISKTRKEWERVYAPIEWNDRCVFGDAQDLAPASISSKIKGLIGFQQMMFAEFIKGDRDLNQWDSFVDAFLDRGGRVVQEKMWTYYQEIKKTEKEINALLYVYGNK